jgi:DNA-binding transcriptional MerR regulator
MNSIKSKINFAKLMKDKIFDLSELISVEDIRKEVNKEKKILGPRTIEFYARYGLLKKSIRITGDKKAYYNKDYIFDALALILLLKAHYNMSLLAIKKFMETIKHNPQKILLNLFQLENKMKKKGVV